MFFKFKRKKMIEKAEFILSGMQSDWSRLSYYLERYEKTKKKRHLNLCMYFREEMNLF